jgi:hypothetical protein
MRSAEAAIGTQYRRWQVQRDTASGRTSFAVTSCPKKCPSKWGSDQRGSVPLRAAAVSRALPCASAGEASARKTRRILTNGMGNLNRRRTNGGARAAVRDDGGCLSRAAPQRFTADGPLVRAQAN